ncbi:MAG: Plug and carboxypeptidase regulatory-like domain-containing protein, partial [Acidobacteriota bacterium]|nr:Plug and carboxypeptidase regulatory-like domain-containing protein [Acidobacteriota bacterium]
MSTKNRVQRSVLNIFRQPPGARRRRRYIPYGALLGALLLLATASVSFAQGSGSTLRGVVRDPKGAVVPNVTVTLTDEQHGTQRQATTSSEGAYVFTAIDPGTYTLKIEGQGFKTYQQQIAIAPSETRSADATLEIGVTGTVTVTAEQPPINTETGERSETITAQQVDNLSIISRTSLELLRILPGVVAPDPSDPNNGIDRVAFGGGANATANYTVNGIRGVNNNVTIDGSRVVDIGSNNGTIITPNVDMAKEVTVKSSNYAAEYGNSGVQFFQTTKSGGKEFHGELYDYIRPNKLQANDRSNVVAGRNRPPTSFQYPGGNIGGPLLLPFTKLNRNRDKLFFFVGFEVQRQKPDRGTKFGTVPTQAERNGDFSQSLGCFSCGGGISFPSERRLVSQGAHLCPPTTIGWSDCNGQNGQPLPVPNGDFRPYKDPIGAA